MPHKTTESRFSVHESLFLFVESINRESGRRQIDSRITILGSRFTFPFHPSPEPTERIIKLIHHPLLQRNDSVISDLDAFRTNFRATLGDVAVPNTLGVPQFLDAIFGIERMHLQRGDVN